MQCENLEVWKRACNISVQIYKILGECKEYGFKDQITRSGLSIPSNIAEGMERFSKKEKIRFLDIARSSCAELTTQIYIGIKAGFIEKNSGLEIKGEVEEISKIITSLIKGINNANQ